MIDPNSIFDCQVKRMHEYKRQHLNALNIAAQYLYLKQNPNADFIPKTYIFGAKASPRLLYGQADDPHDLQAGRSDRSIAPLCVRSCGWSTWRSTASL